MKLAAEQTYGVSISKMKDGDIAVIVSWNEPEMQNIIVMRHKKSLIVLGKNEEQSYPTLFNIKPSEQDGIKRVRILEEGVLLEV